MAASNVVIDGAGNTDHRNAMFGKGQAASEGSITANCDDAVNAQQLAGGNRLLLALLGAEFLAAGSVQNSTAPIEDMRNRIGVHPGHIAVNETVPAAPDADDVDAPIQSGTHEELYRGLVSGSLDLALNDQRRAFSDDYVNMELKNAECIIELSERSGLSSREKLEISDLAKLSCIIVSSKDQRDTEAAYYRDILGFANDFIYAETQEEARLMVIGNRGFLPVEAVGKLPEVSGAIKRIPRYRKNRHVTRKYCLFWQEERTGYYIEEFAEMLRKRLS